ncbi:MAG: hypothetical protein MSQ05_05260 [Akkermansia sp.]|nr:hypothetical protein [Akkermansia sp.]
MKHISQGDLQNGRTHPADGWYIIEAPGRYPTHIGPRTVTQNLSESTLAARNTARRCIAIERDPRIHATALRRLATTHTPNII